MSDLQCAATLLFLSPDDEETVAELAAARVATVYDGQHAAASKRAVDLAAALRVRAASLGEPVTAHEVRSQRPEAMRVLGEVVDLHRGETVVVLVDTTEPFRLNVDADGVRLEPLR
ncbi:MAG TPA: hypothetical protein VFJ09_07170 [Nocardioidaceae bacterium]|jgi:hypothetical protein|nr:hypothetical protein [Nocardioidaceae bacterium]